MSGAKMIQHIPARKTLVNRTAETKRIRLAV